MALVDFVSRHFALLLLIPLLIAFSLPNVFDFLLPHLVLFLMAIMFFVFLKIDLKAVAAKFKNPLLILYIIFLQMFVLPLIVFFILQWFGFGLDIVLGFFLIAAIAPGSSVIAFVDLFKGDLDLGLVIQVIYFLLFPFVFPLFFMLLFGQSVEIDVVSLFVSLATIILVPLALSQLLLFARKKLALKLSKYSPLTTVFFLGLLALAVGSNRAIFLFQNLELVVWIVAGCIVLLAFLLAASYYSVFFLQKSERRTVAVLKAFMNGALALVVAQQFFSEGVVVIVIVLYLVWDTFPFITKALFRLMRAETH